MRMTYKPGNSWEDDTSTKWRGDKLLRAVGKLQQDEKVHRAYLVAGMILRTQMWKRIRIRIRIRIRMV